jgi:hypothetical protein
MTLTWTSVFANLGWLVNGIAFDDVSRRSELQLAPSSTSGHTDMMATFSSCGRVPEHHRQYREMESRVFESVICQRHS